jgi:hypothetical protein
VQTPYHIVRTGLPAGSEAAANPPQAGILRQLRIIRDNFAGNLLLRPYAISIFGDQHGGVGL